MEDSGKASSGARPAKKLLLVGLLLAAVASILVLKDRREPSSGQPPEISKPDGQHEASNPPKQKLPLLLDLGAGKCVPCKMMAPILEELKTEYADRLQVTFIDVWENKGVGEKYGVRSIPTQIFYDPEGKELFRHEGFFSKDDILAKWRELGFNLE